MSQIEGLGGSGMTGNNQSPSILGPQHAGLGTSQSQAGPSTPPTTHVSGSHHPNSKSPPIVGASAAAGGNKTSNGHGSVQGSGGRGRWVNRILVRLGLRSRNQFKDTTSDTESQKRSSRKRLSNWLKRGLLRKEKRNKEKGPQKVVPLVISHNRVASPEENVDPREQETHMAANPLSVVPEHPGLSKTVFEKAETSSSHKAASDGEFDLGPFPPAARAPEPPSEEDEQQISGAQDLPLTGLDSFGPESSDPLIQEHKQQALQLGPPTQSIADLYAASFQPKQPLKPTSSSESRRTERKGHSELGLNAAAVSALGKNGISDQRFGKQPQRQVTVGWLASLPSASDISQLRRDSLGSEVVKAAPGTEQLRNALHQEPSFGTSNSGGFFCGNSSIQHLASSRHPIADAHAEEWRRRTVGGFPIPERYSSRWRPRSRCPSSRRRASIDSRQTTYNPYDLPKIPRQPLFTDLVDLLSLSKAVKSSLINGNGLSASGTNQNQSTTDGVNRIDSFSSTLSINNKEAGGSGDWSSFNGAGNGDRSSGMLWERSGSGSGRGSRLAQQPSSSGDGSTITNTTVNTAGPLFQNYLLPSEEHGSGLDLSLPEQFMTSREESEPQHQQRPDHKGKGKMKTPPPEPASHNQESNRSNAMKPASGPPTAASIPRSSGTSGRSCGSGDSSVPEAWWTNQGLPHGHSPYGYGPGSGRPSTPTSPMTRRMEKWNVRKRRERENNR